MQNPIWEHNSDIIQINLFLHRNFNYLDLLVPIQKPIQEHNSDIIRNNSEPV